MPQPRRRRRPRVIVTVAAHWKDGERWRLTLDTPRGAWELEQLHEMAREAADAAGMLGDMTVAVEVGVRWPRPW